MRKRARVIYNPSSGREALKKDMVDILGVFEQAGYETSAFATTPAPNSARDEAERAGRDGFDLVVAAGGDGTINEVVNGLAGLKKSDRKWQLYRPAQPTITRGLCEFLVKIR